MAKHAWVSSPLFFLLKPSWAGRIIQPRRRMGVNDKWALNYQQLLHLKWMRFKHEGDKIHYNGRESRKADWWKPWARPRNEVLRSQNALVRSGTWRRKPRCMKGQVMGTNGKARLIWAEMLYFSWSVETARLEKAGFATCFSPHCHVSKSKQCLELSEKAKAYVCRKRSALFLNKQIKAEDSSQFQQSHELRVHRGKPSALGAQWAIYTFTWEALYKVFLAAQTSSAGN